MIDVTFTYKCSKCDATHQETHCVRPMCEIPKPCIPYGWNTVNHSLYCPKHVITMKDVEVHRIEQGKEKAEKGGVAKE